MSKGYLSLVLHAHLPFVYHPDIDNMLEERWFYEAITETYIPLIEVFEHLVKDEVPFRLTISLSAPLISMMRNPLLQERYLKHLDKLIELSWKEIDRTGCEPHYHGLALMYNRRFREARELFVNRYHKDLTSAFKLFQDLGYLEIITSAATHGYLPILNINQQATKAQINVAVDYYAQVFGHPPKGMWLPECAYVPGLDQLLYDAGLQYFFLDTHGIAHADPRPRYHVFAPLFCPSGIAAFGRDEESSKEVWSSKEGYPGDPDYREYYRDLGWEREFDYIKPYIHPDGIRINTGMKYWRITGKSEYKEAYRPDWAQNKAAVHAQDFLNKRQHQIKHLSKFMDRKPIVIAPYDAELFGHWWFEGPMWIDYLIRKTVYDQGIVELKTPGDYLNEYPTNQMATPAASSWGYKGFNEFWLNEHNDWIYRHLHMAGDRMCTLAGKYSSYLKNANRGELLYRALNQAARELLLAQSSDWPFIMKTQTMVSYAQTQVRSHLGRFNKLFDDILNDRIDEDWLKQIEWRDDIFKDLDCAAYYTNLEGKHSFLHQAR
ncbi:MAG TPA: 1,4-alpha-glucan branching protein domain-containing protein [Candidatus Omnitrophota bacterium]|nr:1,4-alpha-glucan branching protein domain-containing protein [Candidatus Omnitrophota bacterium]